MRTMLLGLAALTAAVLSSCDNDDSEPRTPSPTAAGTTPTKVPPPATSTSTPAVEPGAPLWELHLEEGLNTFAATDGETVIASATDQYTDVDGLSTGLVVALDAATGDELWRHELPAGTMIPGVGDSIAAVGDLDGVIHAFDTRTGAGLWTHASGGAPGQVVVAGGRVIIADASPEWFGADGVDSRTLLRGSVEALDARTGEQLWQLPARHGMAWAAVVVDENIVYSLRSGTGPPGIEVAAIDATDGEVLWTKDIEGSSARNAPALDTDHVYVTAGDLLSFDRATGELAWRFTAPSGGLYGPVALGGVIAAGGNAGSWFLVDQATGRGVEEYDYCDCPWQAAGDGSGVLYVGGPSFVGLDVTTPSPFTAALVSYEVPQGNFTTPVLSRGYVVVGTTNAGTVAAFAR